MKLNETVLEYALSQNGNLLASDLKNLHVSRTYVSQMEQQGLLERVSRGVYVVPGYIDDTLFCLQQQATKIIYSHETALFLHNLSDRTPDRFTATVPSGYKPSARLRNELKIFYIQPELHRLGETEITTGFGNTIRVYNPERTLCDVLRSRNRLDVQVVTDAIKRILLSKTTDMSKLNDYAGKFGVSRLIHQYLEVLL